MLNKKNNKSELLVNTNNGIKTTARFFSLTSSYVGSIIQAYKKKYDIR